MISILAIGDPHIKADKVVESQNLTEEILRIAKSIEGITRIVVLGDTLDRHQNINVYALTMATDFLCALSDIAPLILLIGNHDRPNNSDFLSPYHPFSAMKRIENITVVDTTTVEIINGKKFLFVPYVPVGRFSEALQKVPNALESTVAVFAHQEFRGAKMDKIVSVGDSWARDAPLVISGHIHQYQRIRENIVYVGAPAQHNFGDETHRTISLFRFHDKWEEIRYPLVLKKKIVHRINPEDLEKWQPDSHVMTKVVIVSSANTYRDLMNMPKIKEWTNNGVVVVNEETEESSCNLPQEKKIPFVDALLADISDDVELLACYKRIFT